MRSAASSRPAPSRSVSEAARRLAEAGCDTPRLDAELLLREGADVERRVAREPVAYILRRKAFRWIAPNGDRRVRIPRADTRTLREAARSLAPRAQDPSVRAARGVGVRPRRPRCDPLACRRRAGRHSGCARARARPGSGRALAAARAANRSRPGRARARHRRARAVTPEDVATFE